MTTTGGPLATTLAATAPLPAGTGAAGKPSADRNRINQDDFYKIMISELSNQDPFEPLDNRQFLEQLASLQTLDATGRLSSGIEKLVAENRLAIATSLIGKEVRAPSATTGQDGLPAGEEIRGKVERVRVQDGEVKLILDGDRTLSIDSVREIA